MCVSIVTLNDLHMINFWGDLKTKFISKSQPVALRWSFSICSKLRFPTSDYQRAGTQKDKGSSFLECCSCAVLRSASPSASQAVCSLIALFIVLLHKLRAN